MTLICILTLNAEPSTPEVSPPSSHPLPRSAFSCWRYFAAKLHHESKGDGLWVQVFVRVVKQWRGTKSLREWNLVFIAHESKGDGLWVQVFVWVVKKWRGTVKGIWFLSPTRVRGMVFGFRSLSGL